MLPNNTVQSKQRASEPVEAAREHAQVALADAAAARPGGRPGGGAAEAEAKGGAVAAPAGAAGVAGNASKVMHVVDAFSH